MKKVLLFLFSFPAIASAQISSVDFYSFRLNNMFNVNPAYAGAQEGLNLVLNGRKQGGGVYSLQNNFMLGAHTAVSSHQAIGGKIVSDSRGAFRTTRADLCYTYFTQLNGDTKLRLGISGGVLNNSFDVGKIENSQNLDLTDPTLQTAYLNATNLCFGTGLLLKHKAFDFSFSLPHLVSTGGDYWAYAHLATFYTHKLNENYSVTPWLSYQNIPLTKGVAALHLKVSYKEICWMQAGIQSNNSWQAAAGLKFGSFNFGYAYNLNVSSFRTVSLGTNEVLLAFTLNAKDRKAEGAK